MVCFVFLVKCEAPTDKEGVEFVQDEGAGEGECVSRCTWCAKGNGFQVDYLEGNVRVR